jgi:hypothetical protein
MRGADQSAVYMQAVGFYATPPPEPFTFFAPTNDAFAALLSALNATREQLLADEDTLRTVRLLYCCQQCTTAAHGCSGQPCFSHRLHAWCG